MSQENSKLYNELIEKTKQISTINSCAALLQWDERTYIPKNGVTHRSDQLAFLAGLSHEKQTDPRIGELLSKLEKSDLVKDELSVEAVNIRELRRSYDKAVKLPKKLVEDITRTTTMAQSIWGEARAKSDFSHFKDILQKVIELKFEQADAYGYETERYDALMDDYEPGATIEIVSKIFADLRNDLVPLIERIQDSGKHPNMALIESDYDIHRQKIFGKAAAAAIGFDFASGRLDVTTHPFCTTIGPGDIRILTRYNKNNFSEAFTGTIHEAGHGMYEQGLLDEHFGTPMGEPVSLGIHESQSRMMENIVGRGLSFWKHFFPRAQQIFPECLHDANLNDFYFAMNDVRPSMIRVDADEVTYNLHILLRFEIEQDIFHGDIKLDDIPAVWNERFTKYFGITPKNDAEGCLQDVHWSMGIFGYFPTYALGNLYASQFYAKALKDLPEMESEFETGDFSSLKKWLNENIHAHGQRYKADKLVEVVTGNPLSHKPLMEYLTEKYSPLYGI